MKILYAIQGTGNGHVCRATEIVPILSHKAEVDVLISGIQSDIGLPFPVKYIFNGLSYIFGKKGGIDLVETYRKSRIRNLLKEISVLPVEEYDMVISDFEPVSAWACYIRNKPCIGLSHQAAVLNKNSPRPKKDDPVGRTILKVYAPASVNYGFHFDRYDHNIFTPVIRSRVREAFVSEKDHYTVYLPAYSDKRIIKILTQCLYAKWHVFSKHFEHEINAENVQTFPLNNESFVESMASSKGVICGAGFETPAEALFLGKKLMVVPMSNQYEQHCNAAALKHLGVPVLKSFKSKHIPEINKWIETNETVTVNYHDNTEEILDYLLDIHTAAPGERISAIEDGYNIKTFRNKTIEKIISQLTT